MKEVRSREKVVQKSIGFFRRQLDFIEAYIDFDVNKLCRDVIDEQISIIDPNYLEQFNE